MDEREAFEAVVRRYLPGYDLTKNASGFYRNNTVEDAWLLWQARAQLEPAVPEWYQKEAEKAITAACCNAVEKLYEISPGMEWDSGETVAEMYIRDLRKKAAPQREGGEG